MDYIGFILSKDLYIINNINNKLIIKIIINVKLYFAFILYFALVKMKEILL